MQMRYWILMLGLTSAVSASDWPQFLGPSADGHATETNLPVEWSKEKNVVWRREVPGGGWSSPVVVGGTVYLTAAVPIPDSANLSLQARAYDAKTGEPKWDREVFVQEGAKAPKIHSKNSHASPTPIVDGDRLFVHFGHQGAARLKLNGEIVWKNSDFKYEPVHGNGGSPALVGDTLIFSADGAKEPCVLGLNVADGKEKWRYARPGDPAKKFAFCTPGVFNIGGAMQVIIPGADSAAALKPDTGEEIWRVKYDGYSVIPRPQFGHGLVFFSTSYDRPSLIAIDPKGTGDITETHIAWQTKRGAPHTPSPLLVGDELYFVSDGGVFSCVDAKTGTQHWQERIGGNYSSSPLFADGKIYLQAEDGKGQVFKPGTTFEKLGENGFGERTLASYAFADGAVFIRTADALYRVQAK